jgi:hypothetical protein
MLGFSLDDGDVAKAIKEKDVETPSSRITNQR